jgi:5-hydroxyisourate hydrolase
VGACGQGIRRQTELIVSAGISVHCVDVAHGQVAEGLQVALYRLDHGSSRAELLASGQVGARGLWEDPVLTGPALTVGAYELVYSVGAYFRQRHPQLGLGNPAFLEDVPYRIHVAESSRHIHLPLKFTPWGFSLFLGVA